MNLIKNASFLDETQGFETATGGNLYADETIYGAPGRRVLVLVDTPGNGGTMSLSSSYPEGPAVTQGELLDVSVMGKSTTINVQVKLQVQGGGEVTIPMKELNRGNAYRGVPSTFWLFRARIQAPSTGQARIIVSSVAPNAQEHVLIVGRPMIERVTANARPRMWTPGQHFSADLNIPVWPSNLPPFRPDSVQCTPSPVRRAFSGDTARTSTERISQFPEYRFTGDLELNGSEYDQLEVLCYEMPEPFFFVRPDTQQLCEAIWAEDGQPNASGSHNIIRRVSVGLILQVI